MCIVPEHCKEILLIIPFYFSDDSGEWETGEILWAKLPGVPSAMMWPARLVEVNDKKFEVFCHADQAV
jgi:hypothetical protein